MSTPLSRPSSAVRAMRLATITVGLSAGASLLLLTGCEVGPDYKPPEVKVMDSFGELHGPTTNPATQPSQAIARPLPLTEWWTTFRDPELDSLVDRATKGNLSLRQAGSRIRQARFERAGTASGYYPEIDAGGGYQHARGSKNVTIPTGAFGGGSSGSSRSGSSTSSQNGVQSFHRVDAFNSSSSGNTSSGGGSSAAPGAAAGVIPQSPLGGGGLPGVSTDLYQAGFDATWELDVFGGVRRQVEAADADTQAAVEDRRDVMVTLLAEVARNYVELRGFQRQAAIARENLNSQRDTLDLTRSKQQAGFSTELDVDRQAAQVAATASELPVLEAAIRRNIHALGTLIGQDPNTLTAELQTEGPIPPVPPEVPVGVPSDLLRRRPDVRRAERQLAAATARVGVATADLFPKFSLTGAFGFDATKFSKVPNWSSRYYDVIPGVTWPIFDAGRIRANINAQNEVQQQAVAGYQETVLTALQDVEDSLVSYRTEQVRRKALADAVDASRAAVDLAKQQYQQGVIDFLTVLDAQRSLLAAQDALVQSDRTISTDLVALYKALGGGWEIEQRPG